MALRQDLRLAWSRRDRPVLRVDDVAAYAACPWRWWHSRGAAPPPAADRTGCPGALDTSLALRLVDGAVAVALVGATLLLLLAAGVQR